MSYTTSWCKTKRRTTYTASNQRIDNKKRYPYLYPAFAKTARNDQPEIAHPAKTRYDQKGKYRILDQKEKYPNIGQHALEAQLLLQDQPRTRHDPTVRGNSPLTQDIITQIDHFATLQISSKNDDLSTMFKTV
jgi:hypothetical protein